MNSRKFLLLGAIFLTACFQTGHLPKDPAAEKGNSFIKAVLEEDLQTVLDYLDDEVYSIPALAYDQKGDSVPFNKKRDGKEFLQKEGLLYNYIYNSEYLRNRKIIGRKAKCIREFLQENIRNAVFYDKYAYIGSVPDEIYDTVSGQKVNNTKLHIEYNDKNTKKQL